MKTISSSKFLAAALSLAVLGAGFARPAAAETQWQKDHPRRAEVNGRLANQDARIRNQVKAGDLTQAQAQQLHQDDHQVRQEERSMASQNGGHITSTEKQALNQQENGISAQIPK